MEFVSFDLAKKLKDLGFNEPFFFFYREDDKDKYVHHAAISKPLIYCDEIDDEVIITPTISQVLKWLRKEKGIFIQLEYINQKVCGCIIIEQKTGDLIAKWDWDKFHYANKNPLVGNTYEKTAIVGIEYCLNNLI